MTELSKNRSEGVDLLRGVAILLVLILHFHLTYKLQEIPINSEFLSGVIKAIARNGNYGVTIFFVISGFLITSMSVKRYGSLSNINLISFYWCRASRIIPCLLLVVLVIVLLGSFGMRSFVNKPDTVNIYIAVLSVLTFWHNVLMEKVGYFNYSMNILWSLSVEEVFYLTFPIICITLRKSQNILLFLCIPIVVGPIYRSFYTHNEIVALYGYLSCFDAIAFGGCAALIPPTSRLDGLWNKFIRWIAVGAIAAIHPS